MCIRHCYRAWQSLWNEWQVQTTGLLFIVSSLHCSLASLKSLKLVLPINTLKKKKNKNKVTKGRPWNVLLVCPFLSLHNICKWETMKTIKHSSFLLVLLNGYWIWAEKGIKTGEVTQVHFGLRELNFKTQQEAVFSRREQTLGCVCPVFLGRPAPATVILHGTDLAGPLLFNK